MLPIAFVLNILHLLQLNKNDTSAWEVRLYDWQCARAYVGKHFPYLLDNVFLPPEKASTTFPVIRVDVLKYLLMYVDGGIYLDIKSG